MISDLSPPTSRLSPLASHLCPLTSVPSSSVSKLTPENYSRTARHTARQEAIRAGNSAVGI